MYKKLYSYIATLLMLGSIFSSPITSVADTQNYQTSTTRKMASEHTSTVEKQATTKKHSSSSAYSINESSLLIKNSQVSNSTAQERAPGTTKSTSKDWQDQFITKSELLDSDGNPKTDFNLYETMQANWDFEIPAGKLKAGDTMTVKIPDVFIISKVTNFDITDASGTVIAKAVADPNTGKITITMADTIKPDHGVTTGHFKIWVQWNTEKVEQNTKVPIDWGLTGKTTVTIVPGHGPDRNETLYKWGWYDDDNPKLIHWRVRVNFANKIINNAVYTDIVGPNQELVSGSVLAKKVKFDSDGNNFEVLSTYPDNATTENGLSGFKTILGDITDTIMIYYDTENTNNGSSSYYENSGNLTGDNIEKRTVDVHTPDNGGSGGAKTTTTVAGEKIWKDQDNQDSQRPNSITVNLLANGKKVQSQKVTAVDNWQYSFKDLPKYDTDGQKITYTVTEDQITDYTTKVDGTNLINSYTPKQTGVTVTKAWNDNNDQDGLRPNSIKVQLYGNDTKVGDAVTLTSGENWTHNWSNLPVNVHGKAIKYTVKEVGTVTGYTASTNDSNAGNIIITNTHTPGTTAIIGSKTWQDKDNQDGKRPSSITVNLLANGKKVQSQKVTANYHWQYSFKDLPKYENGVAVIYTVTEDQVSDYTTKVDGTNLINSYTPKQTGVTVTKVWNDNNDQDGLRPNSIKVQLYGNDTKVGDAVTLTSGESWTHSWSNLPVNAHGKAIKYTVKEVGTVTGYTVSTNDSNAGNIIITNTHTPGQPVTPINPADPTTPVHPAVVHQNKVVKWLVKNHLLPQTGDMQANGLIVLGIALFLIVGGSFIFIKRKHI